MTGRPSTVVSVSALPGLAGASLVADSLGAFVREFAGVDVLLIRALAEPGATERSGRVLALSEVERLPADLIKGKICICFEHHIIK